MNGGGTGGTGSRQMSVAVNESAAVVTDFSVLTTIFAVVTNLFALDPHPSKKINSKSV